LGDWK